MVTAAMLFRAYGKGSSFEVSWMTGHLTAESYSTSTSRFDHEK